MQSRYWRTVFVVVLLAFSATLGGAQDKDKDPPKQLPNYYPMQVGNKWHFNVQAGANKPKVTAFLAEIETIDKLPLARLEASIDGKVIATEHLRATADGIFRHRHNKDVPTEPIRLLKYPLSPKDKWQGKFELGNEKVVYTCESAEEEVAVPAGKFKTIRVAMKLESDTNGTKRTVTTTYWFAENVGFVKQTVEGERVSITMELEKFEAAPKKEGR